MIGMDMRFQRGDELKTEFLDQRAVAAHLFEYRIDQDGISAFGQKIGIGGRRRIEHLAENEHGDLPHFCFGIDEARYYIGTMPENDTADGS